MQNEFLIDNHVGTVKFKFVHQSIAQQKTTECEKNKEFTRIRRKKFSLDLINYLVPDSR